jgi:hypothetical protein
MFVRAFLTVLFACLALSAMAMPIAHAAPSGDCTMAMDHGDHHPAPAQPDKGTPDTAMQHGCLGCIPPTYGMARATSPNRYALALRHAPPAAAAPPASASAPETPPPKALS